MCVCWCVHDIHVHVYVHMCVVLLLKTPTLIVCNSVVARQCQEHFQLYSNKAHRCYRVGHTWGRGVGGRGGGGEGRGEERRGEERRGDEMRRDRGME